ncbi:unnamed protein product [Urochloa decumbens]|uniref:Uncharacterized protein n=1 Tax=Urochloa decumbens TaxID=240449 RepID=A0ABC9EXT2_9POAL
MISSCAFFSIEDALAQAHGTEVNVMAVVANVGPLIMDKFSPFFTREICMKDQRVVSDLTVKTGAIFVEADVHNNFVLASRVRVNRDKGSLEDSEKASITFIDSRGFSCISNLEEVRSGLRTDALLHDGIKNAVAARLRDHTTLEACLPRSWFPRSTKDLYDYMLNGIRYAGN